MCYILSWGKQIRHMLLVKVITFSIWAGGRGAQEKETEMVRMPAKAGGCKIQSTLILALVSVYILNPELDICHD